MPFEFFRDEGLGGGVGGVDVKNGARIGGEINDTRIEIVGCEIVDGISRHDEEERGKTKERKKQKPR